MGLAEAFVVIRGSNRTYLLTFTREEDISDSNPEGRVDLTSANIYYRWKKHIDCPDDVVLAKSSGDAAEIEILTQSGDTLGQAKVYLVPSDTASLEPGTYVYDAWAVLTGDERHAAIEPSEIILQETVTDLSAAAPSIPGDPATQDEKERSFKFTLPSDGDSFSVTIPGSGMYDTSYTVEATVSSLPAGAPLAQPYALETGRTKTSFTLQLSGSMKQNSIFDIHVRDS